MKNRLWLVPILVVLLTFGLVAAQGMTENQRGIYNNFMREDWDVSTYCTITEEVTRIDWTRTRLDPFALYYSDGEAFPVIRPDGKPDVYILEGGNIKTGGCLIDIIMPTGWFIKVSKPDKTVDPAQGIFLPDEPEFVRTTTSGDEVHGYIKLSNNGDYFIKMSKQGDPETVSKAVFYLKARNFRGQTTPDSTPYSGYSSGTTTDVAITLHSPNTGSQLRREAGKYTVKDNQHVIAEAKDIPNNARIVYEDQKGSMGGKEFKIQLIEGQRSVIVETDDGREIGVANLMFKPGFWDKKVAGVGIFWVFLGLLAVGLLWAFKKGKGVKEE